MTAFKLHGVFRFSPQMPEHFFSPARLSEFRRKRAMGDTETQERLRAFKGAMYIREIAHSLGLPYTPTCTALILFHRFLVKSEAIEYDQLLIVSCISLSMKAEETVKKLKDILSTSLLVISKRQLDPDPKVKFNKIILDFE